MDLSPVEAIEKVLGAGMDADFDELWDNIRNAVNVRTPDDCWTALMVACGSPLDTTEFIRNIIAAGADVAAIDGDGWSALHWSAFHGRPESAATLLEAAPVHKVLELLEVRAGDSRLAIEVARDERHVSVEAVITKFASLAATMSLSDSNGLEATTEESPVSEAEEGEEEATARQVPHERDLESEEDRHLELEMA